MTEPVSLKKPRRYGPEPSAAHGTVSAYKRHLRHEETPCEECKAAWAAYHRECWARRSGT